MGGEGRLAGDVAGDGDEDWELHLHCPAVADITIALVGKVGNGKSATANSILGRDAFASEYSYSNVTQTCEMQSATLDDGSAVRTVNVIDTPGLFDMDVAPEYIHKEIAKSMGMARDGIHAVLVVFNAACRFSHEDEKTIEYIKLFFGEKILDHVIFVFTHGVDVGGETAWKKMLAVKAPEYLQQMVKICGGRVILFDNNTRNIQHRKAQRKKLFDMVDLVLSSNCGKPFSNQMFTKIQEACGREESYKLIPKSENETSSGYLATITNMVEEKLNFTILELQKQLWEEHVARQEAEKKAVDALLRSAEEIRTAIERQKKAQEESEKNQEEKNKSQKCIFL